MIATSPRAMVTPLTSIRRSSPAAWAEPQHRCSGQGRGTARTLIVAVPSTTVTGQRRSPIASYGDRSAGSELDDEISEEDIVHFALQDLGGALGDRLLERVLAFGGHERG